MAFKVHDLLSVLESVRSLAWRMNQDALKIHQDIRRRQIPEMLVSELLKESPLYFDRIMDLEELGFRLNDLLNTLGRTFEDAEEEVTVIEEVATSLKIKRIAIDLYLSALEEKQK